MHPATVHDVSVITKLHFAILRHLKNQWPWSRSEVIEGHRFWCQSKACIHIHISGQ